MADERVIGGYSWSYAHHPPLEAPYREEFRPLMLTQGGIRDFPTQGPYPSYRLEGPEDQPDLERYFHSLVRHANELGRRPVFGLTRTQLRTRWFRRVLDGVHVFIRRAPRAQFMSYLHQSDKGTPYFLERGLVILGYNLDDPILAPLAQRVKCPRYLGDPAGRDAFYIQVARQADPAVHYAIFHYLHLLTEADMSEGCAYVIDVDAMASDPARRSEAETRMAELTGLPLSFADCTPESYGAYLSGDGARAFFDPIEADMAALLRQTRS